MTDYELGMRADKLLRANEKDGRYHYVTDLAFRKINADDVTGTVIYAGSGHELSSLFIFENARCLIHQELGDPQLFNAFPILEENGIITDFQMVSEEPSERKYEFKYKGQEKIFLEVFNTKENIDEQIHTGNVALNVHPLAQEGLDAIYFWAFPSEDAIKAIQINLLPHLKIGGVFEGSYYSSYHYGAPPSRLGLVEDCGTYRKETHLSADEIQKRVRYTLDNYIENKLHSPWVLSSEKPRVREEAQKRGAYFKPKPGYY